MAAITIIIFRCNFDLRFIYRFVAGFIAGISLHDRKNIIRIREKNKEEPKAYKRATNYILTGLWYGYLLVFFAGLTINNLGNW